MSTGATASSAIFAAVRVSMSRVRISAGGFPTYVGLSGLAAPLIVMFAVPATRPIDIIMAWQSTAPSTAARDEQVASSYDWSVSW